MSTRRKVVPSSSPNLVALSRVRSVVPKQGMVRVTISVLGRPSIFMALLVIISAKVESRPPDRPMTAHLA